MEAKHVPSLSADALLVKLNLQRSTRGCFHTEEMTVRRKKTMLLDPQISAAVLQLFRSLASAGAILAALADALSANSTVQSSSLNFNRVQTPSIPISWRLHAQGSSGGHACNADVHTSCARTVRASAEKEGRSFNTERASRWSRSPLRVNGPTN